MALVLKDRVRVTSSTTGTGTFTLGSAAAGFQDFSVIGNGNTTYYTIQNSGDNTWEVGIGTYTASGTTLSRDTVLESSNSGSLVNFAAGTKDVFVTYPAEKGLYLDASNNAIGLGTPASATLTNATGLPISTGVSGLGSGVATFLGTPSSSNLASAVTDETGSGSLVFATSPTLVTPALGTPSSGTLTSCTGLPLSTGVTGTLPVTNGGTGTATSFTTGSVVFADASGVYSQDNANLFWDDTNNRLGIGTSAPTTKLTISNNTALPSAGAITGTNLWQVGANATVNMILMDHFGAGGIITGRRAQGTVASPTAVTAAISLMALQARGYGATGYSSSTRGNIAIFSSENWTDTAQGTYIRLDTVANGTTTNLERMRIDDAGNVGIGTSSPSSFGKLSVSQISGSTVFQINTTTNGVGTYVVATNSAGVDNWTYGGYVTYGTTAASPIVFNTNSTERMRIDSSGNVGIGTTSPSKKLDVFNSGTTTTDFVVRNGTVSLLSFVDSGAGYTGTSTNHPLLFTTNNTERMRIDSSGNVGIGTASPSVRLHLKGSNFSNAIRWEETGGNNNFYAGPLDTSGNFGIDNNSTSGYTRFVTNSTERMRINSSGTVMIGTTTDDQWYTSTNAGLNFNSGNFIAAARSGGVPIVANRLTSDGDVIEIRQAGTTEGTISVSGTTVSYNGGHLSRWSQWQNETGKPNVYRGTVLESTNDMCEWEKDGEPLPNEQATKTIVSTTVASKAVAGVFDRYDEDDETNPYDFYVAQSGDFVIRIAQGVVVQNGDLLESAGDGTAKPQADDICRSSTVAKVTSNYVSATYEDGSYCVPCILMIG